MLGLFRKIFHVDSQDSTIKAVTVEIKVEGQRPRTFEAESLDAATAAAERYYGHPIEVVQAPARFVPEMGWRD
jgi:hypothetical protein